MPASEPASTKAKRPRARAIVIDPPPPAPGGRDRRKHQRHPIERPAKLFCPKSGRFIAGRTHNISAGGVLVEVDAGETIESGDAVLMTVAFGDRFIVPMSELVRCTVIRTLRTGSDHVATLAIAYDNAAESAMSA